MNNAKLSILLIEDNLTIASQITEFLEGMGYIVDYTSTGNHGLKLAQQQLFDVVVLDLNLPDCDGLTVCERIRDTELQVTPILMLTARDDFTDKVKGFGRGADDYMTKPFNLRELELRCQALSRRNKLNKNHTITKGKLHVDTKAKKVTWDGHPVSVTNVGFDIVHKLIEEYPYPVSRSEIIQHIWRDDPPESNALKSHIYSLRKALKLVSEKQLITTVGNVGYQLDELNEL